MKNSDILKDYIFINKVIALDKQSNMQYKQAGITDQLVSYITAQIDQTSNLTIVASIVPMVLSIALGCLRSIGSNYSCIYWYVFT